MCIDKFKSRNTNLWNGKSINWLRWLTDYTNYLRDACMHFSEFQIYFNKAIMKMKTKQTSGLSAIAEKDLYKMTSNNEIQTRASRRIKCVWKSRHNGYSTRSTHWDSYHEGWYYNKMLDNFKKGHIFFLNFTCFIHQLET